MDYFKAFNDFVRGQEVVGMCVVLDPTYCTKIQGVRLGNGYAFAYRTVLLTLGKGELRKYIFAPNGRLVVEERGENK